MNFVSLCAQKKAHTLPLCPLDAASKQEIVSFRLFLKWNVVGSEDALLNIIHGYVFLKGDLNLTADLYNTQINSLQALNLDPQLRSDRDFEGKKKKAERH